MTCVGDALRAAVDRLAPVSETPRLDAQVLLAHVAAVSRSTLLAFPERQLDDAAAARFAELVARRAEGRPLAYLLEQKGFFSLTLDVGPDVLVPRSETEHLVEEALARLPAAATGVDVLDLGTGSGALALAIKHQRRDAEVYGADASEAALAVARGNGARLGLRVRWIESDWFAALSGLQFDAILCNPPYVRSGDPHFDGPLRFEPRGALDGGPDGLDCIRIVLRDAPAHLRPGGLLLLEHGYEQQRDVEAIASGEGFELVTAGRDLAGRDRYVVLRRAV